jgi:multiple sugar transport system permease protein
VTSQPRELDGKSLGERLRSVSLGRVGDYLFLAPAMILIVAVLLYPLGYNLYVSLHDMQVGNFRTGTAPFVGLEMYRTVIADPAFRHAFWISLLFTGGSLLFQFTIGFALALFFNRPFPGNGVLRALMLLAWVMPLVVTGSLFRWMLDGDYGVVNFVLHGLGLLDDKVFWLTEPNTALIGTILTNIWIGVPFNMVLLLAGLQSISPTLYEAARVDGANAWRRFLHITLPMMRPVMLIVIMLGFIYTFKVFDLIFVMTGGGPVDATTVLPIYVYEQTFEFFYFGQGAAAATLILIIPLSLALIYLRLVRREEVT